MKTEITGFLLGRDYQKLRQGMVVVSIITLILMAIGKYMRVSEIYTYYAHANFYTIILLIPLILQSFTAVMFPINYRYLLKNGWHKHKLSDFLVPELLAVCTLVVLVIIYVI